MIPFRRSLAGAAAVAAVFAAGVPAASASTALPSHFSMPTVPARFQLRPFTAVPFPIGLPTGITSGPCGTASSDNGQGPTAGTAAQVCMGSGLSFVGPAIGQIATVIGPTIISPGFVGNVVVSAGNGAINP